jgi:hypothetical protein
LGYISGSVDLINLPFDVKLSLPFLPDLAGFADRIGRNALQSDRFSNSLGRGDRGLSLSDPPVLLMPSWYQ